MRSLLDRAQRWTVAFGVVLTVAAGVMVAAGAADVARFIVAGLALAALAGVIGQAIEAVGDRLGPGATGLLQSTLGNLPELFVGIFALRDGLLDVVRAALVGSILGNAVLVLGCAFLVGGLRHGTQHFDPEEPRLYGSLLLLAVAAMLVPTLADHLDTPAAHHTSALSDISAGVLLVVYACSIPYTLRRSSAEKGEGNNSQAPFLAPMIVLVAASAAAALVSDWFVGALEPATLSLGITQTFTGLVIVAIAANAVEHAVGIRFALRGKPEYAVSTTLSSPLQVALFLVPVLVLASNVIGPHALTLDFPTLLVAVLAISAVVVVSVVFDGEYTWIEGVALIGLYVMIAASFWWG
jgi:Ca2+:H+ antiporter